MRRVLAAAMFVLLLMAVHAPQVTAVQTQATGAAVPLAASGSDPVDSFTIVVSSLGMNGTSGNLNMTVTAGDTVQIKFIYADACLPSLQLPGCDNLPFDNPHQMEVEGYQLKSAVIDTEHNESTIQFVAGTTGTFEIHCVIPCEGMDNMQDGWLAVVEPGSAPTSSATSSTTTSATTSTTTTPGSAPTSTTTSTTTSSTATKSSSTTAKTSTPTALEAPSLRVVNGARLNMSVILVTSAGKPIAGVPVIFSAQTDFGTSSLGKNFTGASGWAYLSYPAVPTGWTGVSASFAGGSGYNASSVAFGIAALPAPAAPNSVSPYVSLIVHHPDVRLVGVPPDEGNVIVGIFILVVVCVYLVIFSALGQVIGIRRDGVER